MMYVVAHAIAYTPPDAYATLPRHAAALPPMIYR